tara:strand:- start:54 stop:341 length:288 start_codon:yes stop_codon:yes gene_type:complete
MSDPEKGDSPAPVVQTAVQTTGRFLLEVLSYNAALCLWVFCGLWFFSAILFSWIPMPGISDQPAAVNEVGIDAASFRHIIFDGKLWLPPPSPPPA